MPGVQKKSNVLATARNNFIHFPTPGIPATTLHASLEQVAIDGVHCDLRNLSASRIVEEHEFRITSQRREESSNSLNWKPIHDRFIDPYTENSGCIDSHDEP